jgi:hypothetical protein
VQKHDLKETTLAKWAKPSTPHQVNQRIGVLQFSFFCFSVRQNLPFYLC